MFMIMPTIIFYLTKSLNPQAEAYTEGTIDWFKDGNSLNFDGRVTKSRWGRTVSISNVSFQ